MEVAVSEARSAPAPPLREAAPGSKPDGGAMTTTHAGTYVEPLARRQISPALRASVELLDQRFRVLGVRFGMDALIGLIPGVGDVIGMLLGYGLVFEAIRLRARWRTVARMIWNLVIDATVGALPIAGDLFDFFFHAHRRNLDLLQQDLARP
jgi:hypothetical protein